MARLNDVQRAAFGYWWDLIQNAARMGITVAETVKAANSIAADFGEKLSFAENQAIASLYGFARRIENAGNSLQAADPSLGITADMISVPPYARDVQEQAAYPTYHVKFEYVYLDAAGNQQTAIKTSVFPDQLPATVGQLTSDVLDDAEGMASKYGHQLISVTPLQILAV